MKRTRSKKSRDTVPLSKDNRNVVSERFLCFSTSKNKKEKLMQSPRDFHYLKGLSYEIDFENVEEN